MNRLTVAMTDEGALCTMSSDVIARLIDNADKQDKIRDHDYSVCIGDRHVGEIWLKQALYNRGRDSKELFIGSRDASIPNMTWFAGDASDYNTRLFPQPYSQIEIARYKNQVVTYLEYLKGRLEFQGSSY
tara:strand:- start:2295 stop:2684 length:390 start_codon:yes stop_codon:yes gene_type:complete